MCKHRRPLGAHGECESRIRRQLALIGQLNIAVLAGRRRLYAFADQCGSGTRRIHGGGQRQYPSIFQRDFRGNAAFLLEVCRGLCVLGGHRQFIAPVAGRQLARHEGNISDRQARDLVEATALQDPLRIAGMHDEAVVMTRLGKGLYRDRLRLTDAVLGHPQGHGPGFRFLKRQLHLELIGLDRLPISLQLFACRVFQHDAVDTADAIGLQVNRILTADHQRVFVAGREPPGLRVRIHQQEARTVVALEAPICLQRHLHAVPKVRGMQRSGVDDVTSLSRIGLGGQVDALSVFPHQAQRHVMRITGGKYQRRAVDGQHQRGSAGAVNFFGIHRMQRRQLGRFHRRQRRDQHRLRAVKGRCRVQGQREFVAMQRSQGRNILISRGTEGVEDARNIEHRCDVGAVIAVAQLRGIARLHCQITARAGGQRLDDRCAVPVIQNERLLALGQAGRLQCGKPVETLLIDLDRQAPGQQRGGLGQLGRIGVVEATDRREIPFQAGTIQRRLVEVLRRSYEGTGTTPHRTHQRSKITARFRGQEYQDLLGALGHDYRQSVMSAFARPRLAGKEPTLRRGIGRAAQKCNHHQIVRGLRSRKISLDPNPVAGREIGNFRRRPRLCAPGNFDVKGRTGEVERRGSGMHRCSENYC